ncbi:MAG: hypothetical protein R6X29_02820 [Acidimicrobiia bacterium]|jgi:hypothetical protein
MTGPAPETAGSGTRIGLLDVALLVLGIALVAAAFWWLGWIVWILPVTALLLAVTVAWARRRPRAG